MFKHILLAINGSSASGKAEDCALTVVHVKDDKLCHYGYVDQLVSETTKAQFVSYVRSENESASQRVISEFAKKAENQGVAYEVKLRQGDPTKEIVAGAAEDRVDLVIVGGTRQSKTTISKSAGIAEKIIRQCPCNVMVSI